MKVLASEWLVLNRPFVAGFHSPGDTIYHLMSRGDRREPIFHDDEDRKAFQQRQFTTPDSVTTIGNTCNEPVGSCRFCPNAPK